MHLRELFLRYNAQTSDSPLLLEIKEAKGSYVYDSEGKQYIDLISGISVSNVGHCHPHIIQKIEEQIRQYMHVMVYGEYIQSPQTRLALRLAELLEPILKSKLSVYFTNSGSEATEGAIKLARRYTGKPDLVVCRNSYHGHTTGALSLMSAPEHRNAFGPLINSVRFIDFNQTAPLHVIDHNTAAVFIEIIQSETGYIPGTESFLHAVKNKCLETGTLLIVDEIQTGCGRTGRLFASQHFNISPDIILLGKGLGGGMPIGAFIAPSLIMSSFISNPVLGHMTTFGGHPVNCAAANACLDVIEQENLVNGINELEAIILSNTTQLDIQGKGLMYSLQLPSAKYTQGVIQYCLNAGLLCDWFLFAPDKLRICPPLNIPKNTLSEAMEILSVAVQKVL